MFEKLRLRTRVWTAQDEGSVVPLVAVWLAATVLVAMSIMAGVGAAVGRAQAQGAADAAALAGAADGQAVARRVAEMNGGVLVKYLESEGRTAQSPVSVTVLVEVDGVAAVAAAERFLTPG